METDKPALKYMCRAVDKWKKVLHDPGLKVLVPKEGLEVEDLAVFSAMKADPEIDDTEFPLLVQGLIAASCYVQDSKRFRTGEFGKMYGNYPHFIDFYRKIVWELPQAYNPTLS